MMGAGSPEMRALGQWVGGPIMSGLWLAGDYQQDQFDGDMLVLTWKVHMVLGWDEVTRCYVGYFFPSAGPTSVCTGRIEDDQLVMTSQSLVMFVGHPAKLRFIWDILGPERIAWKNEISVEGQPWQLIEEYVMAPS